MCSLTKEVISNSAVKTECAVVVFCLFFLFPGEKGQTDGDFTSLTADHMLPSSGQVALLLLLH